MGVLADKLSYLDGTKTAIKNAIIAKGVDVEDTNTFRAYADKIGQIEGSGGIPEYERYSIVDDGATSVPNMSNAQNWFMPKVYIPSSVTQIGNYFVYESGITEIIGGENVLTFDTGAFNYCASLVTIDLPSATVFGYSAFYGCTALVTLNLPSATTFSDYAFSYCTLLATIDLPSATTFGSSAFGNCTSLVTIDLPSVTTFGAYAFSNCAALATIVLPSATVFGANAFYGCTALVTLNLPSATTFGDDAFQTCTALVTVSLPSVTTFGNRTFYSSISITNIDLGSRLNVLTFSDNLSLNFNNLTVDSFLQVGNALVDNTGKPAKTIYAKSVAWNRLSTAQKAIFTSKNYTISVS